MDFVQWSGPSPEQDTSNWAVPGGSLTGEIAYKHDVLGRRIEKKVDGYTTRYVHDGDHIIAEYDGNNNLLRKYIFGPGIDQPVCMIEVADANATYYYHYDALGSVVALSDSSGDTVQTYEYSVYGEVAVEDANHPNPYMFAGVRYDIEIGLYYNRARYYNPFTGRFLQTDPIGYGAGMNLYAYCRNNPVGGVDPLGLASIIADIPVYCIADESDAGSAEGDVDDWLDDVGFYEEYPGWYIEYVDIDGAYFRVHLTDGNDITDACDVSVPNFETAMVGGVQVVLIDGVGRLDSKDRTLNNIIAASVHSVNEWWPRAPVPSNLWRLRYRCDTPFEDNIVNWKYKGMDFKRDEINFILEGHAMKHLNIPYEVALQVLVSGWKQHKYKHPPSGGTLYWFEKGYNEYASRSTW